MNFIPPRSGYGLIQEDLWPDEWKILISCIMLNCTSRKQVEKTLPLFFFKWSCAEDLISADKNEVAEIISCLGLKNKRTKNIFDMSHAYLDKKWETPEDLPGIGEYGMRTWKIFIKNDLGEFKPNDGVLAKYWMWRKHGN